jgi:hypothetical protein
MDGALALSCAFGRPIALALAGLLAAGGSHAQELKVSGFASLVAARSDGECSSTTLGERYASTCTRYVTDWAHGAVVRDKWQLDQESRAGLQLEWTINRELSAVVQASARTLQDQKANLEWAYLSYTPTPEWKLQLGRKRIPLYYYSDFQDVGFAYNTVRPSPDVYGWDVVNYNGASLSTTRNLGDWTLRAEVYGGAETSRKNPYTWLFTDEPPDVKWSGIRGLSLEISQDWFTGRVSFTQTDYQVRDHLSGEYFELFDGSIKAKQDFFGLALNGDWDEWQLRSEFGKVRRMNAVGYDASFYLITLGRQFGAFTLTGGLSAYRETTRFAPEDYVPVKLQGASLTLRYDVHKGGAVKLQIERVRDRGVETFSGNARVLSLAYDLVF